MKWNELVRKYFPNSDDKTCEDILWEYTPYPVCEDIERIETILKKLKAAKGEIK